MVSSRTRIITLMIGSVILGALVGIGHVLWSRSAESEIVHYSWPVKWALTFAAESPDLPPGSRFSTAAVTDAQGERWTVAGEVELPSEEGRRVTRGHQRIAEACPHAIPHVGSFSPIRVTRAGHLARQSVVRTDRTERDGSVR